MPRTVSLSPARSEQYPGEWYVVRVLEDGTLFRESGLLTHTQAVKTQLEWIALYCDGRVPV